MSFWNPQGDKTGSSDRQTNYVNWYNSLAPSTRAYAQAPDQVDWNANDSAVDQWNTQSGDNQPLNRFASPGPNPGLNPGPNPGPGYVPPATPPTPEFGPLPGGNPPEGVSGPSGLNTKYPTPYTTGDVPAKPEGVGNYAPPGDYVPQGLGALPAQDKFYTPPVLQQPTFSPGGTPQASGSPVVNAMMRRYKRGFW